MVHLGPGCREADAEHRIGPHLGNHVVDEGGGLVRALAARLPDGPRVAPQHLLTAERERAA